MRCKWHVFCCRIGAALNEDKIVLFLFSKSKEAYGCIYPTGQLPMGTTYQGAKTLVELSLSYKSSIPHESTFPGEMQEALSDTLCAFIVKDSRCFWVSMLLAWMYLCWCFSELCKETLVLEILVEIANSVGKMVEKRKKWGKKDETWEKKDLNTSREITNRLTYHWTNQWTMWWYLPARGCFSSIPTFGMNNTSHINKT